MNTNSVVGTHGVESVCSTYKQAIMLAEQDLDEITTLSLQERRKRGDQEKERKGSSGHCEKEDYERLRIRGKKVIAALRWNKTLNCTLSKEQWGSGCSLQSKGCTLKFKNPLSEPGLLKPAISFSPSVGLLQKNQKLIMFLCRQISNISL